jgi:hypothetical protein
MAAADPCVFRGLPIASTYSCNPAISFFGIGGKTVELESTTFEKFIGAPHGTTALSHHSMIQQLNTQLFNSCTLKMAA